MPFCSDQNNTADTKVHTRGNNTTHGMAPQKLRLVQMVLLVLPRGAVGGSRTDERDAASPPAEHKSY